MKKIIDILIFIALFFASMIAVFVIETIYRQKEAEKEYELSQRNQSNSEKCK